MSSEIVPGEYFIYCDILRDITTKLLRHADRGFGLRLSLSCTPPHNVLKYIQTVRNTCKERITDIRVKQKIYGKNETKQVSDKARGSEGSVCQRRSGERKLVMDPPLEVYLFDCF